MDLSDRIEQTRKSIVTDSYEMSIGEIVNLYKDGDLIISPEYQRLYRWSDSQKNRLIESILLWFPMPSIFVYQMPDGKWELIDGLQRISTILQFVNILNEETGLMLEGTNKIPEFSGITWESLDQNLKRDFKRARIRIEILKSTSDKLARYELFQRLNTGGSMLTPQEVRNCTLSMLNPELLLWLKELAQNKEFIDCIDITEDAKQKEYATELVLRFFAYNSNGYSNNIDVHEFLDKYALSVAQDSNFDLEYNKNIFKKTFYYIWLSVGNAAFKRKIKDNSFGGQFLLTKFEVIAHGISHNLERIESYKDIQKFLSDKIFSIDGNEIYKKYSGSGVRASSRLAPLLKLGKEYFQN